MGLPEQGKVVVGIPMVTSVSNLQFWLQLCDASTLPEARSLVQDFKAKSTDKDYLVHSFEEYNTNLVKQVGWNFNIDNLFGCINYTAVGLGYSAGLDM